MAYRRLLISLAAILVAATAAGCAMFSDRVPGCVSPPNEQALLDELAEEPALAVSLSGTKLEDGPRRTTACHRWGKDVTRASVSMAYELARELTVEEVSAAFDPAAQERGWTALQARSDKGGGMVLYCRDVLDQPSMLAIHWSHAVTLDVDGRPEHVRGRFSVAAIGSADGGMAEMEAPRRAVGCQA